MAQIAFTKDLFLWMMSIIYLFAFCSLYVQIPGLYGDKGLLPARRVMDKEATTFQEFLKEPSLLKLTPKLGLDIETGIDFLCLAGILISFYAMVSHRGRDFFTYIVLWILYLSLFQVGQTFLWFQWDILLLEAGFLTALLAPLAIPFLGVRRCAPHDHIMLWLLKWLLFRLMFASGVVKLASKCPTWWGLTALNVHFESQCIPTPLAWYWHNFPDWFLRLGVVATYVIEIAIPFFFFAPVRSLRLISFYSQVLLQVLIILTGNYNFFNLLTITLCIPLLNDEVFFRSHHSGGKKASFMRFMSSIVVPGIVLGVGAYYTQKLFNLQLTSDYTISSNVAFTEKQFFDWLENIMPWTIRLGTLSLGLEILLAVIRCFRAYSSILWRNFYLIQTLVFAAVAALMFGISLVPHAALHKPLQKSLQPLILSLHSQTQPLQLTSPYGLFRRMTGVGGRPEVVIKGSYESDRGWKEYNFLYKPGNVSVRPPIVAPHQPRLDWQMWFAALGDYPNNPWFVTLMYRLLTAQPEVLQLMADSPFPDKPPKYVQATLYHYHYAKADSFYGGWWTRVKKAEYFPTTSKEDPWLIDFLRSQRRKHAPRPKNWSVIGQGVKWIRQQIGQPEGFSFVMSVFGAGILINFVHFIIL